MKTGYLIEKYNNMASAYSCRRLVEEAEKVDIDLRMIGALDTQVTPNGLFNAGMPLDECDVVVNRYKYGKVKNAINALAKQSYNALHLNEIYVNKYEQLLRLSSPYYAKPSYFLSSSAMDFCQVGDILGLPFVVKGLDRSMGQDVFLIHNAEEYEVLRRDYPADKEWLFEECITTSLGRDLRLFAIRGRAVACMQRKSTSDFRANVARGANVTNISLTPELRNIAESIYEQSQLDFVGIDLLFGKEGYVLCEVNITPGLEGIEQASGVNVAHSIMCMIADD